MALWKAALTIAAASLAAVNAAAVKRGGYNYGNLVDSASLRGLIKADALRAKAEHLQKIAYDSPDNNRVIGSKGHEDTVEWIKSTIEEHSDYYSLELQPFHTSVGASANLTVDNKTIDVYAVGIAPPGHVSGPLVAIPNLACNASDFPADLTGSIILVFRGTCEPAIKVALGASRGAIGAIVYNNSPGNLDGYSLQRMSTPEGPYIPTGGISQSAGEVLASKLESGSKLNADLTTVSRNIVTYNVIAQTKAGDQENVIHIGGHSDSVTAGPGINDNGSGTISLLEIAIQLTNFAVNNAVRFSWWTAEEEGLLGATYYVSQLSQEEKNKIRLFLDFDMMASPNYAFQIYDGDGSAFNLSGPPGSAEAEAEFTNFFANIAKVNHTQIKFDGRSDYGPFLEAGIAAGGIAAGAEGIKTEEEEEMFGGAAGVQYDVNYHEDGDTANNLNYECWMTMVGAIAHMTATYARSFDSLPPRNSTLQAREGMVKRWDSSQRAAGKSWV